MKKSDLEAYVKARFAPENMKEIQEIFDKLQEEVRCMSIADFIRFDMQARNVPRRIFLNPLGVIRCERHEDRGV